MSNIDKSQYSAAGPALGYVAQIEYSLLLALQRMDEEYDLKLSIETADDFVFKTDSKNQELWQTKHHVGAQGGLGDANPDLWKTLHNWIDTSDEESACYFLTTSYIKQDSVGYLLRKNREDSDVKVARERLDTVAEKAGNSGSLAYYNKYLNLDEKKKDALLGRVVVIGSQPTAEEISAQLLKTVRKAAIEPRRLPLIERLLGWWHTRVNTHLSKIARQEDDWIYMNEIENQLHSIAQSLRDDNLPLDDFNSSKPSLEQVSNDNRVFVRQLKMIQLANKRVQMAVYDHNRAFNQRSRWQRDKLLGVGDFEKYDEELIEEWDREFLPLDDFDGDASDEDQCKIARESYKNLQNHSLPAIRSGVQVRYIGLGSLHILADQFKIGWHPNWENLDQLNQTESKNSKPASEIM